MFINYYISEVFGIKLFFFNYYYHIIYIYQLALFLFFIGQYFLFFALENWGCRSPLYHLRELCFKDLYYQPKYLLPIFWYKALNENWNEIRNRHNHVRPMISLLAVVENARKYNISWHISCSTSTIKTHTQLNKRLAYQCTIIGNLWCFGHDVHLIECIFHSAA